jgi:hypothetical protein
MFDGNLQAPSIRASQELGFVFIATLPDRSNGVDDVARLEVASGSNDRVANGTAANPLAFGIDLRTAFRMDRPIRAKALVEPPMRGCDDSVGVLLGDIAGHEPQGGFAYDSLGRHGDVQSLFGVELRSLPQSSGTR